MGEKTAVSKNNDCYFYYYSTCSKGASCPFRHEPAALRNETMCIYWMQGNCNKANCIFRHMEITKQRDRIACWFESQPGGCKKPHCPFQHQNILDHPREEDIKKKPDLILPVKKAEEKAEPEKPVVANVETERQVILPSSTAEQSVPSRQPQYSTPIIVPLQDGESDSESVSGSPQKRVDSRPRLSAQMEWELRRLRQIQEHEANLIGYTFEENQDDHAERKPAVEEKRTHDYDEFVVEEVVEIEDDSDAAHRRLYPPSSDLRSRLLSRSIQKPTDEQDLRHSLLKHRVGSKGVDGRVRSKVPVSERLGSIAGRALAETLGTKAPLHKAQVKRLASKRDSPENVRSIAQRLGDGKNLTGRLGGRLGQELAKGKTPDQGQNPAADRSVASRAGTKKGHQPETNEDPKTHLKNLPDTNVKKRISKSNSEKPDTIELDFTIKSLADIRAEKRKKSPTKRVQMSVAKNGTKSHHACETKEITLAKGEGEVRVLTLAEIRASKQQPPVPTTSASGVQEKRAPSPISFSQKSPKKLKSESRGRNSPPSTNPSNGSPGTESPERRTTFSTRKIAINRSPVKVPECTGRTSQKEAPLSKTTQPPALTVQAAKSSSKTSQAHGATVQEKITERNDRDGANGSSATRPVTGISNKHSQAANVKSNPSSNPPVLNRIDSLLDEEEALLLEGDMLELEDDDVDEDQLLL